MAGSGGRRRFLAPEVVQSSAMDCGPATLKCLLDGFGIPASYGRLREACQTDVDGTSIDTLEEVAAQLGLAAGQIMVPADHLLLAEARALPALVVVRLPNGLTHFVVAWRRHGRLVQVMDPRIGRRWLTRGQFLDQLYLHSFPVPAAAWREWAGSAEFLGPLERRLRALGVGKSGAAALLAKAQGDGGWRLLAALDAAARLVTTVVQAGGLRRGGEAERYLQQLLARSQADEAIPTSYWSVRPLPGEPGQEEHLALRGAVLVRVLGRTAGPAAAEVTPLAPELAAALAERRSAPLGQLAGFLRGDGLLAPAVLLAALFLAAAGVLVEALLLRGLLEAGRSLALPGQRQGLFAAVLLFSGALLLLELFTGGGALRLGRRLETRLRIAFLEKLPRLPDRYFQSRLVSDMAERSHSAHRLRQFPDLGRQFLKVTCELLLTTAALIWLDPHAAPVAVLAAAVAAGLPLAARPALAEQDLRLRTHLGALGRFYLDALLGLAPIRSHAAEPAVRREHDNLLVEWAGASLSLAGSVTAVAVAQRLLGFGLAAWLVAAHVSRGGATGATLLLVYWSLNVPLLGQELGTLLHVYLRQRNLALRLLEPLAAPEPAEAPLEPDRPAAAPATKSGVAICFQGVSVRLTGHTVLRDVDLSLEPGCHVAVVGPSGAGKTTLVGLLLGWHRPADGCVQVDGRPLDAARLVVLRQETAWLDPAVQLWNRPLLDNLSYGAVAGPDGEMPGPAFILDQAGLRSVLEKLPDGWQTPLGEGGGLLSAGEGQRVRLGRAMGRPGARLVILDEPFRGLEREARHRLLRRVRCLWSGATLLCITHDVADTQAFERVLVVEDGRIVEDGRPADLAARPGSRYQALLSAQAVVAAELGPGAGWRRWRLAGGRLVGDE